MNPTIQSGMHPDAESLTAFAEQLLGGADREQILAHMAVCRRCREVVFFAQQAMEAEQPAQALVEKSESRKTSRGWSGGWHWTWVPVAALAGFVGFAVVQHTRHAVPEREMAQNAPQREAMQDASPAKTANARTMEQTPRRDERATLTAGRGNSVSLKKEEGPKALDEKNTDRQKDELAQSVDARNVTAGVAGGAIHGTAPTSAKSSRGGPMAQNQVQQQNYLTQAQADANEVSNKPAPSLTRLPVTRPGEVSESLEVRPSQQAASVPVPASQTSMVPVTGQSLGTATDKVAKLKTAKMILPSGFGALSEAKAARRAIAIDTEGGLFQSEDGGEHWQAVKTQWTGRALLVRTQQPATESGVLSMEPLPQFELLNDKLQTWVSVDGKTWVEQKLPGK